MDQCHICLQINYDSIKKGGAGLGYIGSFGACHRHNNSKSIDMSINKYKKNIHIIKPYSSNELDSWTKFYE